ncbi:YdiU family protein [Salipaludibacillus sp. CUR1]|uniref:protein adenylyltransferase SelO n=1 Tax=Salipaludibacillus sp. CUR1 TaxID=2820003 RepID=UPI001E45928B|nr:YdiU family protein [Salipaludibacillus sp. CUR1]MCE7791548.1 YdiU family protein [Salipaludibacillus sp. CUR1]
MVKKTDMTKAGWKLENSYSDLPENFYSERHPDPVRSPELVVFNDTLAESLGLSAEEMRSEEGVAVLAGNRLPEGSTPIAQAYAGHQFGHFTMLGDGRALLLGEQITPSGERMDIQLKGSGRTPFSRGGDGRAGLGPMLREHIMSEAMHALGISTNRSLGVVTTGEPVYRETVQPGAILTRVADSHLRVGTFQYARQWGSIDDLEALADYTIKRHYPEVEQEENRYLSLLKKTAERQAKLISSWQLVGFIHGVMNTDNMAISGETIDYGPCAFMNTYDPETVFSSIDAQGRYAYGNQPLIGGWNLARFAETLVPLIDEDQEKAVEQAQEVISGFTDLYKSHWFSGMRAKLGLFNEEKEDETLIDDLLGMMQKHEADFTNTFRVLTFDKTAEGALFCAKEFAAWQERWKERLSRQEESAAESHDLMKKHNPAVIPRNHRVEEALEAAVEKEDYSVMENLLNALSDPYAHTADQEPYTSPPEPSNKPYRTYCGT